MDAISVWQAIIATAGGVALAVVIPLIGFWFALRPWLRGIIKGELSDFKTEVIRELTDIKAKLDQFVPFERSAAEQSSFGLVDKPNPPNTRKNELLGQWRDQTLSYEDALELKVILEQEAQQADESKKALIIIALIGLGLYFLTKK